jgi:ribosomal-protein-alanine acetyltransferase
MTHSEGCEVRVRRATPDDISSIMSLERDIGEIAHWPEGSYRGMFEPEAPVRIALVAVELDGRQPAICGFLVGRVGGRESEVENLAVAAGYRRRGIASKLLAGFLAELSALRVHDVTLEVRESNQGARALYEKCGFSIKGRRRSYYREPKEDAILYTLTRG